MRALPEGSFITTEQFANGLVITIPKPINAAFFGGGLFLLSWLMAWLVGEVLVVSLLLSDRDLMGGRTFLIVWLIGWTAAGFFAALQARRLLRRPRPETLSIDASGIELSLPWVGPENSVYHIGRNSLGTLALRDIGGSRRLTVDAGGGQIEIGESATDKEREWLYATIRDQFAA